MNFEEKIGFICNSQKDWDICQKTLFNMGYEWTDSQTEYFHVTGPFPLIICINDYDVNNLLTYGTPDGDNTFGSFFEYKIYDLKMLLRYQKLKNLKNEIDMS